MAIVSLIAALDRNRLIGSNNALPWHLPADLRYFKATTLGKPVLMGRKTWESLGRALPQRRNIVISRSLKAAPAGAELAASLPAALALVAAEEEAFIIGGGEIFRAALPLADRLYLTEIDAAYTGDAWFPELPPHAWRQLKSSPQPGENGAPGFAFTVYERG